ncbi:MAG: hypothetical protein PSV35_03795, partial [bacterium]|nr:hypothetical protein [bacterium]
TCSVANGTGTISGANVSNVSVTCVANTTTLSVRSPPGTIPVDGFTSCPDGAPGPVPITILNTGTGLATNVSVSLPGGLEWGYTNSYLPQLCTWCHYLHLYRPW